MYKYYKLRYQKEYVKRIFFFDVKNGVVSWRKITVETVFWCKTRCILGFAFWEGLPNSKERSDVSK